ncbi:protein FAM47A-like isoform X2 [Xenia sp. Carnegie-2017]|uniref:protein FAM47A-like isoform X2 n=1 Tax=Xenia sp. Carnegie-2017 TaxID=2897299 RepID=UPI001F037827|nr:protein FAM47A-like isoform X2 [Xenia sp. Carnegie-2017]
MSHKYDLLLINSDGNSEKKKIPWYRERLKTKYINPKKAKQCSGCMVGSSWRFIKSGLDDFRCGMPPNAADKMVLGGYTGISPNVNNVTANETQEDNSLFCQKKRFTKNEVIYSKMLPMQQRKHENVEDIEFSLLQHHLALFPHLEESVPPEVFEDVVDILDPELQLESEDGTDLDYHYIVQEPDENNAKSLSPTDTDRKSAQDVGKNRYKWLPKKDDNLKEEKGKLMKKKIDTTSLNDKMQNVTKEFCTWVENLGGETNNIEESTVMSLFASGYETKPTLSVPIHVVELTNVPPELRVNASTSAASPFQPNVDFKEPEMLKHQTYTPSWVKVKYGAWYLNPKTWKKHKEGEPTQAPQTERQENIVSEAKAESKKLDKELLALHGARAFKGFVDKKGSRKPEFLSVVEKLQEEIGKTNFITPVGQSNVMPSVAVVNPGV